MHWMDIAVCPYNAQYTLRAVTGLTKALALVVGVLGTGR